MSVVLIGEGVVMRRLRATTETNALEDLSYSTSHSPLTLVQLQQLLGSAAVGAGCFGLERASTDGGAQCAQAQSPHS